jgi:UDP-glucose/GDP-mannose dehydrogenase family, UDP binding domain
VKPFAPANFFNPAINETEAYVTWQADGGSDGQCTHDTAVCDALLSHFRGDLVGRRIAIWSKELNSATVSESTSNLQAAIERLIAAGASVAIHTSAAGSCDGVKVENVEYCDDKWQAVRNADALLVMSARDEYPGVEPGMLRWHLKEAVVIDCCNCLDREWMAFGDFDFYTLEQLPIDVANNQKSSFPSSIVVSYESEPSVYSIVKTRSRCQTLRPQFA